jgi:hypothetical protein
VRGALVAVDDRGVTVEADNAAEFLEYDRVIQARTVFEWGAAPANGKRAKKHAQKKKEVAR